MFEFAAEHWGLWGLFLSALLSSTLLPGGSEALLVALAHAEAEQALRLLAVATLGNTLGGMISWGLGRLLVWRLPQERLVKPHHQRAVERLRRWGAPILLLSWLPVIGDPLCLAAGWLRIPWPRAVVFIALGKAARYGVLLVMLP